MCGSDGLTHAGPCALKRAACVRGALVAVVHRGPCRPAATPAIAVAVPADENDTDAVASGAHSPHAPRRPFAANEAATHAAASAAAPPPPPSARRPAVCPSERSASLLLLLTYYDAMRCKAMRSRLSPAFAALIQRAHRANFLSSRFPVVFCTRPNCSKSDYALH